MSMKRRRSIKGKEDGTTTPKLSRFTPQRITGIQRSKSLNLSSEFKHCPSDVKRSASVTPKSGRSVKRANFRKTESELANFCLDQGLIEQLQFPLSSTQFKLVFEFLMRIIDPDFHNLPQPFDKDIPVIMKYCGFPGHISKQTFQTLGTSFSRPTVVSVLAHLSSLAALASEIEANQDEITFPNDENGNPTDHR